jgi:TonB family protein
MDAGLYPWGRKLPWSSQTVKLDGQSKNDWEEAVKESAPWFDYYKLSVFDAADDDLGSFQSVPEVSCSFFVEDRGNIQWLQIEKSSGSRELDDKFLNIVRKASPIKYAPSNLKAIWQRILVKCTRGELSVEAINEPPYREQMQGPVRTQRGPAYTIGDEIYTVPDYVYPEKRPVSGSWHTNCRWGPDLTRKPAPTDDEQLAGWFNDLKIRIAKNWNPTETFGSMISYKLILNRKNDKISTLELLRSCGKPELDKLFGKAIREAIGPEYPPYYQGPYERGVIISVTERDYIIRLIPKEW